ncbi:MAG: hypothetical protein JWP37_1045 [Mucilaginibacter sp.]|nr:hypothetical protein [Mucilaginibacter sp.]
MNSSSNIIEIPGLIQNRTSKKILFADEGLTIEKPLSFDPTLFIPGENISAFRFGVKDLYGYKFVFGRQYFIETKDFKNKIFRLKLNSYYGIRRKTYYRIWSELLQYLWDFYLVNQLSYYTELYNIQQIFELAGVTFHSDGISWDKNNKLLWNEIAVKSYQTYFMIHHIDNPKKYKCCVFSIDWNAVVLQSLLKDIVKEHKKTTKSSFL